MTRKHFSHQQLASRVTATYMREQHGVTRAKVAGEIRFVKDQGPESRALPQNYEYNPKAKKPLAKVLWSVSVAMGHLVSAHSTFCKIKAVSISPDGKLGGKGYIQDIREMRKALTEGIETLSAVQDTLNDELRGAHWNADNLEISTQDEAAAEEMMSESDQISLDPDAFVEREYQQDVVQDIKHKD
jgi:hypothetical protein